jgi:hypothetical protein
VKALPVGRAADLRAMRIPVPIGVAALLSLAIAVVTAAACDLSRTWFEVANESDEPLDIMHARAAGLSLRADPARVFTARRMAVRNDLSSDGMAVGKAEAWCEAWQDEGGRLGLDRMAAEYRALRLAWVREQRPTRRRPA